jgi:hypothetical protein
VKILIGCNFISVNNFRASITEHTVANYENSDITRKLLTVYRCIFLFPAWIFWD